MGNNGINKTACITVLVILISLSSASAGSDYDNLSPDRYSVLISGSWNSLRNGRLNNDYIETWSSWGFLDDEIKSGYGLSTEIIYDVSRRVSMGAGLIYIGGSSKIDRAVEYTGDDSTKYHDYLKTRIYASRISVRYNIHMDEINFSFGISESFLFGKASRHHTSYSARIGEVALIENDFHSTGIGFQTFGGIGYRLTDIISYQMEFGYRHFETGDLVEKGTEMAMRSEYIGITEPPVNLDYSGAFISAGLMFRLF